MKNETYRLEKNVQYNHSICTIYISLDNIFKIHCLGEKVKFIPQQSDEETASSSTEAAKDVASTSEADIPEKTLAMPLSPSINFIDASMTESFESATNIKNRTSSKFTF